MPAHHSPNIAGANDPATGKYGEEKDVHFENPISAGIEMHHSKCQRREHDSPSDTQFGPDRGKHPTAKQKLFDAGLKNKTRQERGDAP